MANQEDMWRDIEDLEKQKNKVIKMPNGKKFKASEVANDLSEVYHEKYWGSGGAKADKLRDAFIKKYGDMDNYW